jgi:hypothetical protein
MLYFQQAEDSEDVEKYFKICSLSGLLWAQVSQVRDSLLLFPFRTSSRTVKSVRVLNVIRPAIALSLTADCSVPTNLFTGLLLSEFFLSSPDPQVPLDPPSHWRSARSLTRKVDVRGDDVRPTNDPRPEGIAENPQKDSA